MKHVLFVHGDKGGVGKTQVATRTAAAYRFAGKPLGLIDGDAQNPGLHALCNLESDPVRRCNVLKPEGLDEVFEAIINAQGDILIDLPAGASAASAKFHGIGAAEGSIDLATLLREADARAVVLFCIDQNREPIIALRDELDVFPIGLTDWIVVKNQYHDRPFTEFDNSKTRGLLEERGGKIVDMLRLAHDVIGLMSSTGLDLNGLMSSDRTSAIQRIRAKAALRDWTEQLQNAGLLSV